MLRRLCWTVGLWMAAGGLWAQESTGPPEVRQEAQPELLSLEQCYQIALERNPQLLSAWQQVEGARAGIGQAKAAQGFVLSSQVTYTRQKKVVSEFAGVPELGIPAQRITVVPGSSSNMNASLSRVLYSSGALSANVRAARWQHQAANETVEQTREDLLFRVRSAYLQILKADKLREVAQRSVEQAREGLRLAQARFDAGQAPRFDVIRSEVEVQARQEHLLQADNGVRLAKAALNNLLGRSPETPFALQDLPIALRDAPSYQVSLQQAIAQRPEIRGLQAQIQAARAGRRAARARALPTLALAANVSQQSSVGQFGESLNWNALVIFSWDLFDSGSARSAVRQADATIGRLEQTLAQVSDGIALEVQQAVLNLETARQRVETTRKTVEQAEEAYRIAQLRYREQVGTRLEMTDAELMLTQTRTDAVNALYDYEAAWAQWERAVAGQRPAGQPLPPGQEGQDLELRVLTPTITPPSPAYRPTGLSLRDHEETRP